MKYSINGNVVSYPVTQDEFVLYHAEKEELVVVNEEGYILWETLANGGNLQNLIETSGYKDEILALLQTLGERGYIVVEQ